MSAPLETIPVPQDEEPSWKAVPEGTVVETWGNLRQVLPGILHPLVHVEANIELSSRTFGRPMTDQTPSELHAMRVNRLLNKSVSFVVVVDEASIFSRDDPEDLLYPPYITAADAFAVRQAVAPDTSPSNLKVYLLPSETDRRGVKDFLRHNSAGPYIIRENKDPQKSGALLGDGVLWTPATSLVYRDTVEEHELAMKHSLEAEAAHNLADYHFKRTRSQVPENQWPAEWYDQ